MWFTEKQWMAGVVMYGKVIEGLYLNSSGGFGNYEVLKDLLPDNFRTDLGIYGLLS